MLVLKIGITTVINQEPAAPKWAELGAHAPCLFGSEVKTFVQ